MRGALSITLAAALALTVAGSAAPGRAAVRDADAGRAVPADTARDTLTSSYVVDGIRVIQRRVTSNDVAIANLYLLGGTRQITPDDAGIEPFLLAASEWGTARYPRERLRAVMSRLGSTIVIAPEADWTMFGLRAIRSTFDSTWAVFADRVMAPTLDSAAVERVRAQLLTAARQRRDVPDALAQYLADSLAFAGHPYALSPDGTEQSLARITRADLRRYHDTQLVTSRMLLIVVGNVGRADLQRLVHRTLGRLPRGSYQWTLPPVPPALPGTVLFVQRSLPTNYILGYYVGPPSTSPDYQALRIADAVLSGQLFTEIRARRNLTYAVDAPFRERAIASGGLYVTTVSPDTTLALMRSEIGRLQAERVSTDGLYALVQQFITQYFLDNETDAAQADFLARAQLYRGDWRAADRFVDELRRVTPDDVQRVARQYIHDVRFVYIGDSTRVSRTTLTGF